jgi:arginine/lysine/ornithine decarboxylase
MTSLDLARYELATHGKEMIANAVSLATSAREQIADIPGISCPGAELKGRSGIADIDATRLIVSAAELGITGFDLKDELYDGYGVDLELSDHMNALGIVTYANTEEDMNRLVTALEKIASGGRRDKPVRSDVRLPEFPPMALTPREAYFRQGRSVPWKDAVGKITAESVAPYPPGIPVVYSGEIVTQEIWEYIESFRAAGRHLHGPADGALSKLKIIE